MKHKDFSKKLVLKKATIINLDASEQGDVRGGYLSPTQTFCGEACHTNEYPGCGFINTFENTCKCPPSFTC